MKQEFEAWLSRHCTLVDSVSLGALLLARPDGLHVLATWPAGQMVPPALVNVAAAAVARQAPLLQAEGRGPAGRQLLAHPLVVAGQTIGVAVLALASPDLPDDAQQQALADSVAAFCAQLRATTAASATQDTPANPGQAAGNDGATQVLRLAHAAFDAGSYHAGAVALLTQLAAQLRCDRASLGFRERGATRVEFDSDGAPVRADRGSSPDIAAAMDEAIDDAQSVRFPPPEGSAPRILAAHARLARTQGLAALATVPLVQGGQALGALVLERSLGEAFTATDLALLEDLSRTVTPWLQSQRQAALPWHRRLLGQASQARSALGQRGHGRYKLAALVVGLALGALAVVPVSHELSAPARLEGRSQRVLAAPGDGFLRQVLVRPGDTVKAGQLLLEFAGEELQIERTRLAAEVAGEEANVGDAMARQDRAKLAVSSAKLAELQAELALADQKLARARVTAPFDGVVISGDLSQTLGAPVKRGDTLLTLAPADGYRALVEVDDADIDLVRQGQSGSLVLAAQPNKVLPATVTRITPLASLSEGRNVFEVEVRLAEAADAELRPGMRGVARLKVGDRPLAVLWTRDAFAWLRLASWRWIG
ncbi:membrane-fusion protein [Burkholderiales bacterium JOSHI_001]|nr:membrane-fusion protein [Burkholderiales bacterium JOSHI_001]